MRKSKKSNGPSSQCLAEDRPCRERRNPRIIFRSTRPGEGGSKLYELSISDRWAKDILLGAKLAELFIFEARPQADRNYGAAHRSATIRADFAARVRSEKRREI